MSSLRTLVALDPGHFHAALVQKRAYPGVDSAARVFAPEGPELEAHLNLVESFNSRAENPTSWREDVYRGPDFLERFSAAARGGSLGECPIVVLAGKNDRKGDYALAAVEAGCNVLSDKPMGITPEVFEKTVRAARLAKEKGLCFADIMTERNEITAILQRELSLDRELYGDQDPGTPEDPAIVQSSVHHFCKLVGGSPLRRPEWYYDTNVQGEGIVDVTSHLVDLIQWSAFPGVRLSAGDVEMLSARSWPTVLTPSQFRMSTGGSAEHDLEVEANGEFTWRLRGVHCRASVAWNFMAPEGGGDTHLSLMRGTRAEVAIRQGREEGYKPAVYVRSLCGAEATRQALAAALGRISRRLPGVASAPTGEEGVWRIEFPKALDVGHEAHFGQSVCTFLGWLDAGREDDLYIDNMIVKYHTIVEAWKLVHDVFLV